MWILAAATIAIDLAFAYCVFTSRPRVSREHVCALCPAVGIAYIFVAQYALRSGGACLGRPSVKPEAAEDDSELAATVPCALFGALLCQGLLQLMVAPDGVARGLAHVLVAPPLRARAPRRLDRD